MRIFLAMGAGGNPSSGLAGGGATTALVIANSVFLQIGEICVGGPEFILHLGVGFRPGRRYWE